jgi:hypothetical protein
VTNCCLLFSDASPNPFQTKYEMRVQRSRQNSLPQRLRREPEACMNLDIWLRPCLSIACMPVHPASATYSTKQPQAYLGAAPSLDELDQSNGLFRCLVCSLLKWLLKWLDCQQATRCLKLQASYQLSRLSASPTHCKREKRASTE